MAMRDFAEARVDVLLAQPADPAVRAEVIETMAAIDPAAYRIGVEAVWLAEQQERAAAIGCPTLVLCGTEDKATPPALSTELAALIPGAQLVPIEARGPPHQPRATRPIQRRARRVPGLAQRDFSRSRACAIDRCVTSAAGAAEGVVR